jgi:uncharacterized protein (TIGR02147 family)
MVGPGQKNASAVDVFAHLDYRRFLDDWFRAAKVGNPRFSHRMFARMAGQKSPSLLLQVIRGNRNLTAVTAEAFSQAMGLPAEEAAFFADLVRFNQAETQSDQNQAWLRISASRRFREARLLEGQAVEYISHWYYPAIRELAYRDDFDPDPTWLSRTLRPRVTVAQARQAMEVLLSLGLLSPNELGIPKPSDASVVTPHEVAGLAARNYHRGMLELAQDSIEAAAPAERHLVAVTVCIPQSLVPRLKDELNAFQERLLDLCDGATGDPERVYQMELALFPLSEPPEEAS